jgi:hypothetical protein
MNLRNRPCPCNSGKKYKKCCGDEAKLNEARRVAEARQMEIVRARAAERQRQAAARTAESPGAFAYRRSPMMAAVILAAALAGGGRTRR